MIFMKMMTSVRVIPYARYEYDRAGRKTREIVSRRGVVGEEEHIITYRLDGLGRVITIIAPYSEDGAQKQAVTEINYDGNGNKTKVVDANNTPKSPGERKFIEYTYTAVDAVKSEKDSEGYFREYRYNADGTLEREIDPRGYNNNQLYPGYTGDFVTEYHYDWLGRLESKKLPLSPGETSKPVESYTYFPNGNVKTTIAPDGGEVSYNYTARNLVKTQTVSGGGKQYRNSYEYDECGNETEYKDTRNNITVKHYDDWDRLDYVIHPELNEESYEYDKNDNIIAYEDGERNRTTYTYDKYDRKKTVRDAKLQISEYRYDRSGNVTRMNGPIGNVITCQYDELNRLIREVRGLRNFNYPYQYKYDAVGNLVTIRDPNGTVGIYTYDSNNMLLNVTYSGSTGSKIVEYTYDEAGYKKSARNDMVDTYFNHAEDTYEPDPYGRVRRESTLIGGKTLATEYNYDKVGRIIGVKSPSRAWVNYEYNRVGELVGVPGFVRPGTVQYDGGGYLESVQAANGAEVRWEYDRNNRIVGLHYASGSSSIKDYAYAYDKANNVIWKNDNYYAYDELNQLIYEQRMDQIEDKQENQTGVIEDDFFGGKPLEFVVPGTFIKLDYASNSVGVNMGISANVNRIELVPNVGSPVSRVYDHEETLSIYSSGSNGEGSYVRATTWAMNKKENGVLEIRFSPSIQTRYLKVHCSYDDRDAALAPVNRAEFQNYAEDMVRVYAYLNTIGVDELAYDGAGNRTVERVTQGGTPTTYVNSMYTHTNRLKSNERYAYVYDANGNMIKKGTHYTINGDEVTIHETGTWWDYNYDVLNRLVAVKRNGATISQYSYDWAGRRVHKANGSGTRYYAFSPGGKLLYEETNTTTGPTTYKEHVYAFGDLFARVDGVAGDPDSRVVYYYHTDAQGSVESITNGAGTVVWRCAYTAFGKVTSEQGTLDAVPMYTGKELDEDTGLYYFNARWYDSDTGRFVTEDPARDGLNWYLYVGNNPLTYTDPTGLRRDGGGGGRDGGGGGGDRGGDRGGKRGNNTSDRSDRKSERQDRRDQRQQDRQDRKDQRQQDRQNNKEQKAE